MTLIKKFISLCHLWFFHNNRFSGLITDRSKYYTYMLRSDPQHAQLADRDYQRKLRLLKTDYSTKADYMRSDVRVYNVMSDR